jgi:hypothetical protein
MSISPRRFAPGAGRLDERDTSGLPSLPFVSPSEGPCRRVGPFARAHRRRSPPHHANVPSFTKLAGNDDGVPP